MGFRTNQMIAPVDGGTPPPMDYQQALQRLIEQRKAAQAPQPSNDQNDLGILLNQLMSAQASMGNISGKPTESTGVDFQDYGKAASERAKQNNLLANQNFEQGLQQQQAGMQADKFALDAARQPEIDRKVEEDRLLKNKLMESQITENTAQANNLSKPKVLGGTGFSDEDKDLAKAIRIQKYKEYLANPENEKVDPGKFRAASEVVNQYETELGAKMNTAKTKNLTPAQLARDKLYASDYNLWVGKERLEAEDTIKTLNKVIGDLSTKDVTGGFQNRLPNMLRTRESIATEEDINNITAKNIRLVLGGQVTEKDREFIVKNSYDPTLDEKVNKTRMENMKTFWDDKIKLKDREATHYEKEGTVSDYKPMLSQESLSPKTLTIKSPDGRLKIIPAAERAKWEAAGGVVQ